jgi:hypothetical protein
MLDFLDCYKENLEVPGVWMIFDDGIECDTQQMNRIVHAVLVGRAVGDNANRERCHGNAPFLAPIANLNYTIFFKICQ